MTVMQYAIAAVLVLLSAMFGFAAGSIVKATVRTISDRLRGIQPDVAPPSPPRNHFAEIAAQVRETNRGLEGEARKKIESYAAADVREWKSSAHALLNQFETSGIFWLDGATSWSESTKEKGIYPRIDMNRIWKAALAGKLIGVWETYTAALNRSLGGDIRVEFRTQTRKYRTYDGYVSSESDNYFYLEVG